MRLNFERMVLALLYALLSYVVLLYFLPKLLSGLGLGSAGTLPQGSLYSAAGIVVLEALSALFSKTRFRGIFMVALGLLAYVFTSFTFHTTTVSVGGPGYVVSVDIAYIVVLLKVSALIEAARGCVAIMADNS